MRIANILTAAVVIFSGMSLSAQQAGAAAQENAAAGHVSESSSANANANMHSVSGELQGKLDAKTAKPGDQVIVKTREKMQTADGDEIPKGTRLVGHVTQVQAHDSGHADSSMGIAFDRAELKDGRSLPIHSSILSVSQPADAMAASSMSGDDMASGAAMAGGGATTGGRVAASSTRSGGGLVGGAVGGVSSTADAVGRTGSNLGATTGNTLDTAGRVTGDTTGAVDESVHGAANGAGSLTAHATGIPGVMLAGDASGSASGVLSASKRNVHLDSGTQMELGISAAAR